MRLKSLVIPGMVLVLAGALPAFAGQAAPAASAQPAVGSAKAQPATTQSAQKKFVSAYQLMTPEERKAFHAKMRSLKTPAERQALRAEHRKEMEKRAKARGLTLIGGGNLRELQQEMKTRGPHSKVPAKGHAAGNTKPKPAAKPAEQKSAPSGSGG